MDDMLSQAALEADPERYFLIDVRDASAYAAAHVAGAVLIPLAELAARAGEIPAGRIPVTVCGKGGGRSAEGVLLLRSLGRTEARWLDGGTTEWLRRRESGLHRV